MIVLPLRRGIRAAIRLLALMLVCAAPGGALAQGTGLTFSGLDAVRGAPIELRADRLSVDTDAGETILTGNAVLGQGDMRLAAPEIRIYYTPGSDGSIQRLEASGGVTLVTAAEAAEAREAVYEIVAGTVSMRGSVILTQGRNVLSGDMLDVNLRSGTGQMQGNVRSIIQTSP